MTLEKDIHQLSKFKNEHHKALVNLIYTYNWTVERHKKCLEAVDITLQQFNILRILRGSKDALVDAGDPGTHVGQDERYEPVGGPAGG